MNIPIYQVDAFSSNVFGGNPAAVCPLTSWISAETMQSIAAENNLAETAFFVPKGEDFHLRWFTPRLEVDLCGHATLASAHVIFEHLGYKRDEVRFHTLSGELIVKKQDGRYIMDFPAIQVQPLEETASLTQALGFPPKVVYQGGTYYMAIYDKEEEVLALNPNFFKLQEVDILGICVTAPGNNCDFISRFFAPRAGINEDPVTGSAHCRLIPYWSRELGKTQLHAWQLSERKGEVFCEDRGERVWIGGNAATYLKGEISV